jgi:hypothetical protein
MRDPAERRSTGGAASLSCLAHGRPAHQAEGGAASCRRTGSTEVVTRTRCETPLIRGETAPSRRSSRCRARYPVTKACSRRSPKPSSSGASRRGCARDGSSHDASASRPTRLRDRIRVRRAPCRTRPTPVENPGASSKQESLASRVGTSGAARPREGRLSGSPDFDTALDSFAGEASASAGETGGPRAARSRSSADRRPLCDPRTPSAL